MQRSRCSRPAADPEYPPTHCRCGQGQCQIYVSGTEKNRKRKFYRCPGIGPRDCKFFKWCDELRMEEIRDTPPAKVFPMCGCGAGVCRMITTKRDGLSYLVCHIEKGEGACSFSKLLADHCEEYDDPSYFWPEEEVLAELEGWGSPAAPKRRQHSAAENIESPPDVLELECAAAGSAKSVSASFVIETPEMVATTCTEAVDSNRKPAALELLQPVGVGMLTPDGVCDAVVMDNSPGSYPGRKRSRTWNVDDDNHGHKNLVRCLSLECSPSPYHEQGNNNKNVMTSMTGVIVQAFDQAATHLQKELTDLLSHMSPHDHLTMSKESERTFSALDRLQADYHIFSIRVNSYIQRAGAISRIEKTMRSLPSEELLIQQYKDAKSWVVEMTNAHEKAVKALSEADIIMYCKLQKNDALGISENIHQQQQQKIIRSKAKEIEELEIQVVSLSGELWESERRLEDVFNVLKQAEVRHIEQSAAKAAVEKAKELLSPFRRKQVAQTDPFVG